MTDKNCSGKTEVYSRVVGYYRPIQNWNISKQEEYKDRVEFIVGSKKNVKEEVVKETIGVSVKGIVMDDITEELTPEKMEEILKIKETVNV